MGLNLEYEAGSTPLDINEVRGLIPTLGSQGELNEFEFLNISEAVLWADRQKKAKSQLLTLERLKEIHIRMFNRTWKWAGQFRKTQKSIGVESYRITSELANLIQDVKVWIEFTSCSKEEIVARFHHRLVWIHPFPNGNGRHSRLCTDLLCDREKWPRSSWAVEKMDSPQELRRSYIRAQQNADRGNYTQLVEFMFSTHGVETAIDPAGSNVREGSGVAGVVARQPFSDNRTIIPTA